MIGKVTGQKQTDSADTGEGKKPGRGDDLHKKSWLKKHWVTLLIIGMLIIGLCIMLYPTIANYWNSFHQTRAISTYMTDVSSMDQESYLKLIEDAQAYNRRLSESGIRWVMTDEEKAEYEQTLTISDTGIMGYLTIEKIQLMLPIYHGQSEAVLQTSIGHLEGTSLPVGCKSFNRRTGKLDDPEECGHIVLSGHRGLPSAKLFSNLDKMVEGDTFTLTVLNETYTYEVDQIRIVLPEDLSQITLEKGKDYCTLVTCTPYGINTHRLLVRGHRILNVNGDGNVVADALLIDKLYIVPFVGFPILVIILVIVILITARRRKRRQIFQKARKERDNQ